VETVKPVINDRWEYEHEKKEKRRRSRAVAMSDWKLYKEIVSGRPKALKRDEVSKKRG